MADKKKLDKLELLAPAGSIKVFEKAVEAGADAVYIGAPALNARAQSRNFSLPEIAAMIDFAHGRDVKLYLAANSLLKEEEIPQAIETLALLEELKPDGLILQDLGIYHLCRKYFPGLRLHASTLLGAHNSLAVKQFDNMGFERIVLARELTLKEIKSIAGNSNTELEVFIHGALCFSYSGLCMFSSYLGGKSGLRGRCVQPCRRRYRWKHKSRKPGYFFSMNDLSGIDLVHKLKAAGVSSLKIEGRLRSAQYVASVVKAYRQVIDAEHGDRDALAAARELLSQSMGRKTSRGYFPASQPKELISPYHSGNIGIFLGQAEKVRSKGETAIFLKHPVKLGDRLRLHQEGTGERVPFTLKFLTRKGRKLSEAKPGENVVLNVPATVKKGDSFYKVDSREARDAERKKSIIEAGRFNASVKKAQKVTRDKIAAIKRNLGSGISGNRKTPARTKRKVKGRDDSKLQTYIRIDNLQVLKNRLPVVPDLLMVELNKRNFDDLRHHGKTIKKFQHKMAWCLPPVIMEGDVEFYRSAVDRLIKNKFRTWQIGHVSQQQFFSRKRDLQLLGDYTLNILNSQALHALQEFKISRTQAAIEIDKTCLKDVLSSKSAASSRVDLGLTVYGMVPLFTARPMSAHFKYGQSFISPKGEEFVLRKAWSTTLALADKPFSLLARINELKRMGLRYVVIDLSHQKISRKESEEIGREFAGKRPRRKLSTFNYDGALL